MRSSVRGSVIAFVLAGVAGVSNSMAASDPYAPPPPPPPQSSPGYVQQPGQPPPGYVQQPAQPVGYAAPPAVPQPTHYGFYLQGRIGPSILFVTGGAVGGGYLSLLAGYQTPSGFSTGGEVALLGYSFSGTDSLGILYLGGNARYSMFPELRHHIFGEGSVGLALLGAQTSSYYYGSALGIMVGGAGGVEFDFNRYMSTEVAVRADVLISGGVAFLLTPYVGGTLYFF